MVTVRPVQFRSFACNYLAVTSRGLTTISLQQKIVYGCNYNRARSGAKNTTCLGNGVQIFALQYYNLHIYFLPVIPDIPDDCFCSVFCLHVNIFQEPNKTAILA